MSINKQTNNNYLKYLNARTFRLGGEHVGVTGARFFSGLTFDAPNDDLSERSEHSEEFVELCGEFSSNFRARGRGTIRKGESMQSIF